MHVAPNLTEILQFVTVTMHLLFIHGGACVYVLAPIALSRCQNRTVHVISRSAAVF